MSVLVVDASVAVRWLVDLPHSGEARSLLTYRNHLIAPDVLPSEVGSALTKLVRAKVLTRNAGAEAFEDFFRAPVRILPAHPVAHRAMKLALRWGQSFYDCLYLALAEAELGVFATADGRFWHAMRATRHGGNIRFVGEGG